jgi:hypothetical protein
LIEATTQSAAVAIVEAYRTASGLPRFVTADACTNPTVHSVANVTSTAGLPFWLAEKSLAAHPAFAAAEDNGKTGTVVTIYTCQ